MLKQVVQFEVKEALTDEGTFAGYGAVFSNMDMGRDIILPGAFTDTLAKWKAKGKLPKMFWQHNSRQPMGKWTAMNEDSYGLFCRGRLTKGVQVADEARLLMLDEALDGLSIGYETVEDEYDTALNVRKLAKLDLWEVSPVSIGMNPEALISSVKAAARVKTIREFEDFLRDEGGFSHAAAKAIAAGGFKSSEPRDEDDAAIARQVGADLAGRIRALVA